MKDRLINEWNLDDWMMTEWIKMIKWMRSRELKNGRKNKKY